MDFLDRLLGREDDGRAAAAAAAGNANVPGRRQGPAAAMPTAARDPDAAAIERYHYLLHTAPPETIEQAHAEAFARLTPEQRRQVLKQISKNVPTAERPAGDDPQTLARAATRAEVREPGFLDRTLGARAPQQQGAGMGAMIGGSLLSSIAGAFVGSSVAHALFDEHPDVTEAAVSHDDDEPSDAVGFEDPVGDFGGGDAGGFDL